ncbi:MAG: bifunctional nuclease family protein [Xanthomonadales bacterium]|nr:bifunctional nuclease family protein [Xanthomonadales bacterium]
MTRLLLLCLVLLAPYAASRELAIAVEELVTVEVRGVGVDPDTLSPAVMLVERQGERMLPIYVGWTEAEAIERARRRARPERPLTHELLGDLLVAGGVELKRVIIDSLREGTYFAFLEVEVGERRRILHIDARPSDAIALALRFGVPILVSRSLLRAPGEPEPPPPEDEVTALLGGPPGRGS